MSIVVVEPPKPLLTPEEAQMMAPVLAQDGYVRVRELLAAAQAVLEPPSWLRSSLGLQTLELRTEGFGHCRGFGYAPIDLPFGPVRSIVSVTYDGVDGAEGEISPAVYRISGKDTENASLALMAGKNWPGVRLGTDSVRIRYIAGFPRDDIRLAPVKQAIVLSVVQLRSLSTDDLSLRSVVVDDVDTRTYTVSDAAEKLIKNAVDGLLSGYQQWAV
ncbi:hypothetical protein [Methylopila sp. 73B]|uniref:hypothetical protein n=1 Tax=Methylopila sp. 73B TaxID=1120792 RepID=UPI0003814944|nr:hypothetical protein [Methylopila sp. 73B]